MIDAVVIAIGVVFVAELGDKSQLVTLAMAARWGWRPVLTGVAIGTSVLMGASALAGALLGDALPRRPLEVVAGLAFLGFAWWTWRDRGDDDAADELDVVGTPDTFPVVVRRVTGAFVLAELGDKTMLATITLASTNGAVGTWIGATIGEVAANVLAVVVGGQLGRRLAPERMALVSSLLFAGFGILLLAGLG